MYFCKLPFCILEQEETYKELKAPETLTIDWIKFWKQERLTKDFDSNGDDIKDNWFKNFNANGKYESYQPPKSGDIVFYLDKTHTELRKWNILDRTVDFPQLSKENRDLLYNKAIERIDKNRAMKTPSWDLMFPQLQGFNADINRIFFYPK